MSLLIGYDRETGSVEFWARDDGHLRRINPDGPAVPDSVLGDSRLVPLVWDGTVDGDPTDYRVIDGRMTPKPLVELSSTVRGDGAVLVSVAIREHDPGDRVDSLPLVGLPSGDLIVPIDQTTLSGEAVYAPETDTLVQVQADRRLYRSNVILVRV